FVGAQVALSFVLLVGAGLLVRSLVNRLHVSIGFPLEGKLTAELSLRNDLADAARIDQYERIIDLGRRIPGVTAASAGSIVPMSGDGQNTGFDIIGRPTPPSGQGPVADVRFIDHEYIRTMGIPLLAGRLLDGDDRAGRPVHVLIDESGAKRYWPG